MSKELVEMKKVRHLQNQTRVAGLRDDMLRILLVHAAQST